MSRTEGSFKISGALEPRIASALDARTLVQTKAELTASGNFPYPYVGLEVYVISENKKYRFIGSDTTDINDWEEVDSGGGGSDIQVDTMPTASADELGNIYQYVGVTDTDYTNGCFYECVSDGEATPTYSWEMKPVMPSLEASDMADIVTPLPTGGRVTGFTPIGTIIPMIAETAPLYYLKCDGATYNKSDYPELAAHLLSMTNHSMYEVSGDDTKFKVPDLRGEFLRGTGTNGHGSEGSGANVGVHQNGTSIPNIAPWSSTTSNYVIQGFTDANGNSYGIENSDGTVRGVTAHRSVFNTSSRDTNGSGQGLSLKLRPTNTSVLYCIATKDIYIDARNIYSTTEKVVGEWIDGETLYQKTIVSGFPQVTTDGTQVRVNTQLSEYGISEAINVRDFRAIAHNPNNFSNGMPSFPLINATTNQLTANCWISGQAGSQNLCKISNLTAYNTWEMFVTIQYTKATT